MDAEESRHGPQWREAMAILRDLWKMSADWTETDPLAEMARDAAVALSARIAAADEEEDPEDIARALDEANGKLARLESLLILARDLGQAGGDDLDPIVERLDALSDALRERYRRLSGPFGDR